VKTNIEKLKSNGVEFVEPLYGDLASGHQGIGRLNTIDCILSRVSRLLTGRQDLQGKKLVVTAGPTREYIDPTRFISNPSSGKMGYAIAEAAQRRGADVALISGPTTLSPPAGVELCCVETAGEMQDAVLRVYDKVNIAVMAAAVSDYRPQAFSPNKLKKSSDQLSVPLERNADIAEILGQRKRGQILVCFAAETNNLVENARSKLINKNCDLMVANDILAKGAGFGQDTNIVTLLDHSDKREQLPLLSKKEVADIILDRVVAMIDERG
ncbi:MAG: bifunctional phosphopantothenoylcysteine decarboxylase/phosphopantothenate--cysteine ligase CoaBC, partial [Candidatus Poribacteria bacterium]|nr:bifunctional phosphopantothenoylcysteine decarboxylase/phosphopantothenate--cysteine ligase CoaBC [Candidatus Poribacteria bacterium]